MRQALNQVTIEGILEEINLTERDDSQGRHYINGTVTFLVKQTVGGIPEEEHIPVRVFAYQKTKMGKDNPVYTNAYEILHKGVSIAAAGIERADHYQASGATIRENTFEAKDGKTITYNYIQGSFFRKSNGADSYARFSAEPVIWAIEDEVIDDVPTGRLIVKAVLIQYGDIPDYVTFVVEDVNAANYIRDNYSPEDTVKIDGRIRYTSSIETVASTEVVGFGEAESKVREKTVKEFVITSGSAGPLDEERSFDVDEVLAAINAKKEKAKAKASEAPKTAVAKAPRMNRGF